MFKKVLRLICLGLLSTFVFVAMAHAQHFPDPHPSADYYSVLVQSAEINGVPLEAGDEIAVFCKDNAGNYNVVGGLLRLGSIPGQILAYADDDQTPEKDGFQSNEEMMFVFWDASSDTEIWEPELSVNITVGGKNWGTGSYALVGLSAEIDYTLTVNIDPTGGGSVTKVPDKAAYEQGEQVTLTATPNTGYRFVEWTGDATGTNPTVTLTMDSNKKVTAHFIRVFSLTVNIDPPEGGVVMKDPDKTEYDEGEQVTLTATPNPGYRFLNWTGEVADPNSPATTVTMDAAKEVTANFELITYTLTMAVNPVGGGTTDPAVGAHVYSEGTVVDISATSWCPCLF